MSAQHNLQGRPWGLLPEDIIVFLEFRQWRNRQKLKCLLNGDVSFPLHVSLKPPKGRVVLEDINHFQNFVSLWQAFENKNKHLCHVQWRNYHFRALHEQHIPTKLSILNISALAQLIGVAQERELVRWKAKITHVFSGLSALIEDETKSRRLFCTLIDHLEVLDQLDTVALDLLIQLIPQLHRAMGSGGYIRSLPITFVDTKFVETHWRIIESIIAAVIDASIEEIGLLSWLDCTEKPKNWLLIKPLCAQTKAALSGMPWLRLSSETLLEYELPAKNILIIENEQSCLALPEVAETIAVSGGGKNLIWMRAKWLMSKKVAYWGDIDSEGLCMLSDARSKLSAITPLMMDAMTVETYRTRMVDEKVSRIKEPVALTLDELNLFKALQSHKYIHTRLEQERLPRDYVTEAIKVWLA